MAHPPRTGEPNPSQLQAADDKIFAAHDRLLTSLLAAHPDLATLCASELAASYVAPAKNISAAIGMAEAVVWGRLTSVTPSIHGVTAHVTVLRARQGDPVGATMDVMLNYGVEVIDDRHPPYVLTVTPEPGAPVLVSGDEALLLLVRAGGFWSPEPGGELAVDSGRIDSAIRAFQVAAAPFSRTVDGMTPDEFFTAFVA